MNKNLETLDVSKYLLLKKLLNSPKYTKLFNSYDEEILKKRFSNQVELSTMEDFITTVASDINNSEIRKTVETFIKIKDIKKIYEKRNIYEIIKISNLSKQKIQNSLSSDILLFLAKKLEAVSVEADYISFDFLVLRSLDAFITKISDTTLCFLYKKIRKSVFNKMLDFNYEKEKKEKITNYFCWIDRLLSAAINKEIGVNDYINLNKKIATLIPFSPDVSWKILHCVNFLCFQPNFSDNRPLRNFKRNMLSEIKNQYYFNKKEPQDVENLMIGTLAKQDVVKEDFYYLFDSITILFNQSEKTQLFCLSMLNYILYIDKKQNIFCHRFIREYFLATFFKMLQRDVSIHLKEEEFKLLILLFHNNTFFFLHKKTLLRKIVLLLKNFAENNNDITKNKYNKYCDVLDYILSKNSDLIDEDIIQILPHENNKISKRFQLFLSTYG